MKIKSINDVITNSSDETYIVKTPLSPLEVKEKFEKYMHDNHPDDWHECEYFGEDGYTFIPDSYISEEPGEVTIEWNVMCNLSDAYKYLQEVFGEDNVKSRW